VQQALGRGPHCGNLSIFRGRRADLAKIIWHDGVGMPLHAKRLERGRFPWPSPADGCVVISGAQLAYMLDGRLRSPTHGLNSCTTANITQLLYKTPKHREFLGIACNLCVQSPPLGSIQDVWTPYRHHLKCIAIGALDHTVFRRRARP
jgi:hypothetical protein